MNTLYAVKNFGRYHFFKTEELRKAYLDTLPEWEAKYCEVYEVRYGKVV